MPRTPLAAGDANLVPENPVVDPALVVGGDQLDEMAPVVIGVVVWQIQTLGNGITVLGRMQRSPVGCVDQEAYQLAPACDFVIDLVIAISGPEIIGVWAVRLNVLPPKRKTLPAYANLRRRRGRSPRLHHSETGVGSTGSTRLRRVRRAGDREPRGYPGKEYE